MDEISVKVEDKFSIQGRGEIIVVFLEKEDSAPKIGDKIVVESKEREIIDIECFRMGMFDEYIKRAALLLKPT